MINLFYDLKVHPVEHGIGHAQLCFSGLIEGLGQFEIMTTPLKNRLYVESVIKIIISLPLLISIHDTFL
jgi:hypothetical protein